MSKFTEYIGSQLSQGVAMSGIDYLNGLDTKDYRVTWRSVCENKA